MSQNKIEQIPNNGNHSFLNDCVQSCNNCPMFHPYNDNKDLLCEVLDKEQLMWLFDNSDKLKRWLKL